MQHLTRVAVVIAMGCAPPLWAQASPDAAFLFAYRIRADRDSAFFAGYARHLRWHAEHRDSLPWLAWTIATGPRVGLFVDGSFGISLAAFDARVEPAADAADAQATFVGHSDPADRAVLRLRHDLSTAAPLEERSPGRMQVVTWLTLKPGSAARFERAMRALAARDSSRYAVYQLLSGGVQPAFVVIRQIGGWSGLAGPDRDLGGLDPEDAGAVVAEARSEIWAYRSDLTYFPERPRR